MSFSLGSIFVKLDAETTGFLKGVAGATTSIKRFAGDMKKMASDLSQVGGALTAIGAGALHLASTVDGQTKKSLDGLKASTTGLAVEVAHTLLPAVQQLTKDIRAVADWFANLSPHTKAMISSFATFVAQATLLSLALSKVAGLASGLATGVGSLAKAIAGIGVGALIEVVLVIGVIAGAVVLLHKAWRENWGGIADYIKSFLTWLQDGWAGTMGSLGKFVDALSLRFLDALDGIAESAQKMFEALGWDGASGAMKGLKEMVRTLREDVARKGVSGVIKTIVSDFVAGGKAAGKGFVDEVKLMMKELGVDIDHLFDGGPKKSHSGTAGRGTAYVNSPNAPKGPMMSGQYGQVVSLNAYDVGGGDAGAKYGKESHRVSQTSTAQFDKLAKQYAIDYWAAADQATETDWAEVASSMGAWWNEQMGLLGAAIMNGVSKLSSMLGDMGDLIQSGIQGFQTGGIWGALIAMILELLSKFRRWGEVLEKAEVAFGKLLWDLDSGLGALVDAFMGLMDALDPLAQLIHGILNPILKIVAVLFKGIADTIGVLIAILAPVLEILGTALGGIADLLKIVEEPLAAIGTVLKPILGLFGDLGKVLVPLAPLFAVIGFVLKLISLVILGIFWAIGSLINAFQDLFDPNGKDWVDTNSIGKQIDDVANHLGDGFDPNANASKMQDNSAKAAAHMGGAADDASIALTGLKTTADEVSGGLRNVPSGYKVAMARFNAENGGGWDIHSASGQGGVTIEKMVVVTNDPDAFGKKLVERAQREAYRANGNKYSYAFSHFGELT